MNTSVITFQANEQSLVKSGGINEYASSTAGYVLATFTLGTNWVSGYDVVSAYFRQGTRIIPMVLNHQGQCFVPPELLKATGKIFVNLSGSVVVNNTKLLVLQRGHIQAELSLYSRRLRSSSSQLSLRKMRIGRKSPHSNRRALP